MIGVNILGCVLLIIQSVLAITLIRDLRATARNNNGRIEGVAVLSELLWIVAGLGWFWYGLWSTSYIVALSGVVGVFSCAAVCICVGASVSVRGWSRSYAIACVFLLSMFGVTTIWSLTGLSVFLSVFGLVQFISQISYSVAQLYRGTVVQGVAMASAFFRSGYTALWVAYAVICVTVYDKALDWPLVVWGVTGTVAFFLQGCVGLSARRGVGVHSVGDHSANGHSADPTPAPVKA